MSNDTRDEAVYMAKLAEQGERYDEMVEEMKKVAQMVHDQELSVEERNLLSVAYKNVIGARRASWRIISSIEQKEESKGNEEHVKRNKKYREVERPSLRASEVLQPGPAPHDGNDLKGQLTELGRFLLLRPRPMNAGGERAQRHLQQHPGPAGRAPDSNRQLGREQGVLPEDEGRLPPLPGRVQDRQRPQGGRRAHPAGLQGCSGAH